MGGSHLKMMSNPRISTMPGQKHRDDGGHHGQLEREHEAQLDLLGDRRARPHGAAEVEAREPPHPLDELPPQRPVEAEARPLLGELRLRGKRALAGEAELDDVPRHDAHEEEDERRHPDERREHQEEALDDVLRHSLTSPASPRPPPPASAPRLLSSPPPAGAGTG